MLASNIAALDKGNVANILSSSQKVRALVSKAGYETPKVVSFAMDQTEDLSPSRGLAGNTGGP